MKPIALIAVASGSNDVDVIVTASVMKRLGMNVVIASVDGWSAVTLQNGLVIKPTSSLDRALGNIDGEWPFDVLLLPDGDYVSIGRLKIHPKLALTVKSVTRNRTFGRCMKTSHEADANRCIIAVGGAASALHAWEVLGAHSNGYFAETTNFLKAWLLGRTRGPAIVYDPTDGNTDLRIIICSKSPYDKPLQTVKICVQFTRELAKRGLKDGEREKLGDYQARLLDRRRRLDCEHVTPPFARSMLVALRDGRHVPFFIKKFWINPICASALREIPGAYHFGKLYPGCKDAMNLIYESTVDEIAISEGKFQVLARSSAHVVDSVWNFVQESLKIKKRPVSGCKAAILVANRVNEQLLAVLVHELRIRFRIFTQIVACDRGILRTRDPYVITHGMFQIRSDAAIERVKPFFDIIIAVDSEIDSRGPGVWFRRSSFDLYDFQTNRMDSGEPNQSSITAVFDLKDDGGYAAFRCMKGNRRMRLNPLTNEWIRTEDIGAEEQKAHIEAMEKGRDHGLVFQSFSPFHCRADMRTTIHGSSPNDAVDFAKAVSDYLRQVSVKKGFKSENMLTDSICNVL